MDELIFETSLSYCRAIKKLKSQSDSSLLSELRSDRREKIVELDGTVTTQPVLQHLGISTWPGMLFFSFANNFPLIRWVLNINIIYVVFVI